MAGITSLLCLIIMAGEFTSIIATDYNNVKLCKEKGKIHTMVKYPSPTPGPACGKSVAAGLNDEQKKVIINKHKKLRIVGKIAAVQGTKTGQQPPAVSGVDLNLSWDKELAEIAQRWANQCTFANDECRHIDRFPVGQFVAIRSSKTGKIEDDLESIIQTWYDQVAQINKEEIDKFLFIKKAKGSFLQLIWADVKKIGCGAMTFKEGSLTKLLVVCNYGNFITKCISEKKKGSCVIL